LRAWRDRLPGLTRRPTQPLRLLLGLFKRMPDRRRRRAPHFELRDHAIDTLDVGIDRPAVVATDRNREGDIEDVLRHVKLKVAETLLLLPALSAGREVLRLVRLGRFVVDHVPSMPNPAEGGRS